MRRIALGVLALTLLPSVGYTWQGTQTCYPTGIYKCEAGEVPRQVHWKYRCVGYEINEDGTSTLPQTPDGKISDNVIASIETSFETWNELDCSDLSFVYVGTTDVSEADYDSSLGCEGNTNVIVFRDETWPYAGASAFALTSVTFEPSSGLITDADIEMNSATHEFTLGDEEVVIDVQNTITHEAGHFLGLDHAPSRDATMFFSAAEGETKKRELDDDDIEGACTIYPLADSNLVCGNPPECNSPIVGGGDDDGCCASVQTKAPNSSPFWIFAALALAYRVRRRAISQN